MSSGNCDKDAPELKYRRPARLVPERPVREPGLISSLPGYEAGPPGFRCFSTAQRRSGSFPENAVASYDACVGPVSNFGRVTTCFTTVSGFSRAADGAAFAGKRRGFGLSRGRI